MYQRQLSKEGLQQVVDGGAGAKGAGPNLMSMDELRDLFRWGEAGGLTAGRRRVDTPSPLVGVRWAGAWRRLAQLSENIRWMGAVAGPLAGAKFWGLPWWRASSPRLPGGAISFLVLLSPAWQAVSLSYPVCHVGSVRHAC